MIQINDLWHIKLLDKKQLYRNEETIPSFGYTAKEVSKRVGKVIKINDSQFKTFRKMIPNLINSKDKNKGNLITNNIYLNFIIKNSNNYFDCKLSLISINK